MVEQHSAMRFAWLRKEGPEQAPGMTAVERLIYIAYNLVWWVPVFLAVFGIVSFRTGTVGFLAMSGARALINAYRVNGLAVEVAQRFPLRSP